MKTQVGIATANRSINAFFISKVDAVLYFTTLFAIVVMLIVSGCSETKQIQAGANSDSNASWYTQCGWIAENYFTDLKVIALCRVIEDNDLKEIDRLVAAGADVNAKGKGNMTPLLWAFPDNRIERFKKLLEHGADPNVIVETDFNSKGTIHPGHSVAHLAAGTKFPTYFEQVMKHGGDPELVDPHNGNAVLHVVVRAIISKPEKKKRIQLLLKREVELNCFNNADVTPAMDAVSWFGQYDIALMLLEAGANPGIYQSKGNQKLVHFVAAERGRVQRTTSAQQKADYGAIVQRLEDHGDSIEEARKDVDRWMEWGKVYPIAKASKLMAEERAERIAREKAEAEKTNGNSRKNSDK